MNRIQRPLSYINLHFKCSHFRSSSFRFSSNSSSDSSSDEKSKDKQKSKTSVQKTIITKNDGDAKLKSLEQQALTFQSISPNEQKTINRTTAKPTIHVRQSARPKSKNIQPKDDIEHVEVLAQGLDKRLVEAARRVAGRMPKHLAKQTEKKLLDSVQEQKKESAEAAKKFVAQKEDITKSISFKILRARNPPNKITKTLMDEHVGSSVVKIKLPEQKETKRPTTSLFSGECLSIFDPKGIYMTDLVNRNLYWEKLSQRRLELSIKTPPENFFDEQIKWTEDGKLWKYPINNEQGLESEESVPFYEHVLLDNLLNDFPSKGPVRQFMELVIMGLSQNPYVTVERKRETIKFYKNFFEENNLLVEFEEVNE